MFAGISVYGGAPLAYAASFNNDPLDYQTLRVGNTTKNPSSTSGNWGTSVNADAGDIINFAVYYHNTSNETATNVRATLAPQNSGTGASQTFTAALRADNVPTLTATAVVSISSSQSINYDPGSVVWRPNQTTYGSQTLLNSQTGDEIFSANGLYLGDIGPGWSTQGSVVVAFRVSGTPSTTTTTAPPVVPSYTSPSYTSANYPIVYTYLPEAVGDGYAVLRGYANPNGAPDVTRWFEWGTAQYSLTNQTIKTNQGNSAQDFSQTISSLSPNTTYYYRAVAQNNYGTSYGTVLSFTSSAGYGGYAAPSGFTDSPIVVTNLPDRISDTSMKLNGTVLPRGYVSTSGWFDWGTTPALGNKTQSTNLGSALSIDFSDTLYGLSPNTLYYYQAVGQNQNGIARGSILTFRTNKTAPPPAVSAPATGGVAAVSKAPGKITINITTDNEELIPTQISEYKVTYKNIGGSKVYDAVLRVVLPAGIDFESSKSGFSSDKNILTLELGEIGGNEDGTARFEASVNKNTKNKDVLVTTAIMTYRVVKDGDLEAADDSVSNIIISDPRRTTVNGLAALSFFGDGTFLPNTLLEWVMFTLATMGIVYFSKKFYGLYNARKNYRRRKDDSGEEDK